MVKEIFESVMIPIANPDDARETARAVRAYLDDDSELVVAHVVEKGEGVPDKAPVRQREQFAEKSYETFVDELQGAVDEITPVTLYGRNVGKTVLDGAQRAGVSAIVFTPRGAGRLTKLVTGSVTEELIRRADMPVLVLPKQPDNVVIDRN